MTQFSARKPAVSVVIPTFNRPDSTERAVRSALAQTLTAKEIVVVDDGSRAPFVWRHAASPETEIRVLRFAINRGASAARQEGIAAAHGDLIAFLDSDDTWEPEKLQAQVSLLEQTAGTADLTVAVCGWTAVSEEGEPPRYRIPRAASVAAAFASGCWFSPGSTAVIPRTAFEKIGLPDASLRRLEDLDWFLRFGLAGGRIVVSPILGATISIGRRGRVDDIDAAAKVIMSRIDAVSDDNLARTLRRRLHAYLDLERANSAFADKRFLATAGYLSRSLARKPRLRLPLERWWDTPFQPITPPRIDYGRS